MLLYLCPNVPVVSAMMEHLELSCGISWKTWVFCNLQQNKETEHYRFPSSQTNLRIKYTPIYKRQTVGLITYKTAAFSLTVLTGQHLYKSNQVGYQWTLDANVQSFHIDQLTFHKHAWIWIYFLTQALIIYSPIFALFNIPLRLKSSQSLFLPCPVRAYGREFAPWGHISYFTEPVIY